LKAPGSRPNVEYVEPRRTARGRGRSSGAYWFVLTGLLVGAVAGLLYAWLVSPARFVETAPYSLRPESKDQYRLMIAAAYGATGDLGRAQARLTLLRDPSPEQALAVQAQRLVAGQSSYDDARLLALLAIAISEGRPLAAPVSGSTTPASLSALTPPPVETSSGTVHITPSGETPVATFTPVGREPTAAATLTAAPTATRPPQPTRAPTATPGSPFVLDEREELCDPQQPALLQVYVRDAAGTPVPGVGVVITWSDGDDEFFTGLVPKVDLGYADFAMEEGVIYALRLGAASLTSIGGVPALPVGELAAEACTTEDGMSSLSGWKLVFTQK